MIWGQYYHFNTYYMTWKWLLYFNTYALLGKGWKHKLDQGNPFNTKPKTKPKKLSLLREPLLAGTSSHFHLGPGEPTCVHFSPGWPDTVLQIWGMPRSSSWFDIVWWKNEKDPQRYLHRAFFACNVKSTHQRGQPMDVPLVINPSSRYK